jgi:hypothetical protein
MSRRQPGVLHQPQRDGGVEVAAAAGHHQTGGRGKPHGGVDGVPVGQHRRVGDLVGRVRTPPARRSLPRRPRSGTPPATPDCPARRRRRAPASTQFTALMDRACGLWRGVAGNPAGKGELPEHPRASRRHPETRPGKVRNRCLQPRGGHHLRATMPGTGHKQHVQTAGGDHPARSPSSDAPVHHDDNVVT